MKKPPENPNKRELTPKQQVFVLEYLIDLNATQAAIRAGYSKKTAQWQGPQLLVKTHVAAAIQAQMDKRAERTEITADYVLETIRDTVERCRQVQPVLDRKGEQVYIETPSGDLAPAYMFDPGSVLKGCDLLGKNLNLWKDVGSKENPLVFQKIERVIVKPK